MTQKIQERLCGDQKYKVTVPIKQFQIEIK